MSATSPARRELVAEIRAAFRPLRNRYEMNARSPTHRAHRGKRDHQDSFCT
jgi:hypothetical protein